MMLAECPCDAPAVPGLQSRHCDQPMATAATDVIGYFLQSIRIPPFNMAFLSLAAF